MQSVSALLTAAAALLLASCDAFTITSGSVQPLSAPDEQRLLEQTYSIGQGPIGDMFSHEALQTLKISVPGRVFVSFKPTGWPQAAATVQFSGNNEELFSFFEVVSLAPHVAEVRPRHEVRGFLSDAYMLTEISVSQSHTINHIVTAGAADVVIEDRVLMSDGAGVLKMELTGSGNVYVDSMSSKFFASVSIASSGSGSVHWSVDTFQAQSFKVALQGSGDVTFIGHDLDTTEIQANIAGSGNICVDATTLRTSALSTATLGSGDISFSSAYGHCTHEDVTVLGSGDAYLGQIQCNEAKVTIAGSGDIVVHAVEAIRGTAWGSGAVRYVGTAPQLISDRHDQSIVTAQQGKKYHPVAKPAKKSTVLTCKPGVVPVRAAIHVNVSFSFSSGSAVIGPLIFFAIISLCYLRSQKRRRRRSRGRVPQFGAQNPQLAHELQPLQQQPQYPPQYPPPQQYQQTQQPQTQVYI